MRLFKEVPITSAEQAEALPVATVAYLDDAAITEDRESACKVDEDAWGRTDLWRMHASNTEVVGWTALVPIEAEEETMWEDSAYFRTQTRLVTPGEPA